MKASNPELTMANSGSTPMQTTCEIYHATQPLGLLPSVQSSLYHYLHLTHRVEQELENSKTFTEQLKNKIRPLTKAHQQFSYKAQIKSYEKCDIVFSFFTNKANGIGIQSKLAEQCHQDGFKTGIINNGHPLPIPGFTANFPLPKIFVFSGSSVPLRKRREIAEQCKYVASHLEKFDLTSSKLKIDSALAKLAIQTEDKANLLQYFLEVTSPKLVILVHGKILEDIAMQIACQNTGTLSMLVPHGFPQRSIASIDSSYVASFGPHLDDYLQSLSSAQSQVLPLGWIEPSVALGEDLYNHPEIKSEDKKHNVLFLSSLSGYKIHRCSSLSERVPSILQALDSMPEIETINMRLRSDEYENLAIRELLDKFGGPKLKVSIHRSLAEDLKACDIVLSFNSTGLLYGPYLNKKAIEIRDASINSVWGNPVLPSEQVYQIGEQFQPNDFRRFVLEAPTVPGEAVFHNWRCELPAFSKFLSEL
ncbi:MAG: hypothetical protein Kow00121_63490 [Elainellaceae cyanobacterium]